MKRIATILLLVAIISSAEGQKASVAEGPEIDREVFLFVHGAWGGGWEYAAVDSMLTKKGHNVYHPTLTGWESESI